MSSGLSVTPASACAGVLSSSSSDAPAMAHSKGTSGAGCTSICFPNKSPVACNSLAFAMHSRKSSSSQEGFTYNLAKDHTVTMASSFTPTADPLGSTAKERHAFHIHTFDQLHSEDMRASAGGDVFFEMTQVMDVHD